MRLIIHCGFGRCGSSSIQQALQNRAVALRKQSIFLFGEGLRINNKTRSASTPFWKVAEVFRDARPGETVTPRLSRELDELKATRPDAVAILSAEILSTGRFEKMFEGMDGEVDTTLVFYIRPQFEWIPSAWMQWYLRDRTPLSDFLESCLSRKHPDFRVRIADWTSALPRARLIVRVLPLAIAENESPAGDFLKTVLGLEGARWHAIEAPANPSLDYGILHILNNNPALFESKFGNRPFSSLQEILPEKYLRTNVSMLSRGDEARVAECFREDNIHLLENACGLEPAAARQAYDAHFQPRSTGRSYDELSDIEKVNRALGVLLDVMLQNHKRKILRPPYRKAPWRLLKRLSAARRER